MDRSAIHHHGHALGRVVDMRDNSGRDGRHKHAGGQNVEGEAHEIAPKLDCNAGQRGDTAKVHGFAKLLALTRDRSGDTPAARAGSARRLRGNYSANPAGFDGTWSVQLVSSGGLCGSGSSSVLTVRNDSVRGGSGVSVSGQVGPSGSVSLALQRRGISGSASGRLSGSSGSGSALTPPLAR